MVGTAGHVDHGKTSLVRALTGVNTDRWREEQERGLTIDIGFARLPLAGTPDGGGPEVGVVDVPGHEDFVKNMLAGATGIDLLLLVVAADEGPMPQTREHLAIAHLLGVRTGVVALTKVDRVEEDWRLLAEEAVREELRRLSDAEWPIIPVSNLDGTGVSDVCEAIVAASARVPPRDEGDLLRMPIDRSFTLPGAGTVVTGTVWSGRVSRGDRVRILPADRTARVRSLEVHGDAREEVAAGRRCALALVGIGSDLAARGATVTSHPTWTPAQRIGARIELLRGARALKDGQRVRVFLGTSEVMARVRLSGREIQPGTVAWARLDLEAPLLVRAGDRFIIRFLSPVTTIGGGRAAELDPPNRWSERTSEWERIHDGSQLDALLAAVRLNGRRGLDPAQISIVTGRSAAAPDGVSADLPEGVVECGGRLFLATDLSETRAAVLAELARVHAARRRSAGGSLESLRAVVGGRYHAALVQRALAGLVSEGAVVVQGPVVRLPGHEPTLTPEESRRMSDVLGMIEAGGIEPPAVADIRSRLDLERELLHDVLRLLTERGVVVPITPDLYLSASSESSLRARARQLLEREGTAGPASFKGEFRVSRKYLIPLLEHLDRTGLTRRVADGRQLVGRE